MHGGDNDQRRILDPFAHIGQERFQRRFAEFGDIRTCDKGAALADDNHGFDAVIGLGLRHTGHQTFTNSMGQRIDRGFLIRSTATSPLRVYPILSVI